MTKEIFYRTLQTRTAQASVGAQTMRNAGAAKMVEISRNYLAENISLDDFFEKLPNTERYYEFLDYHTNLLRQAFPFGGRENWGVSRKVINIFLRDIVYNSYFSTLYNIPADFVENNEFIKNMEVPLDSHSGKKIITNSAGTHMKWNSIKGLTAEESKEFQNLAKIIADDKKIARVHLDIEYWRSK